MTQDIKQWDRNFDREKIKSLEGRIGMQETKIEQLREALSFSLTLNEKWVSFMESQEREALREARRALGEVEA